MKRMFANMHHANANEVSLRRCAIRILERR